MNLQAKYEALVEDLRAEGVRLVGKERVWHQRAIHYLLCAATLGAQRRYLDSYVTTIGRTIYVTPDWERRALADRWATLRHERVHVAQFRRWGRVPMALAYLMLPLPVGLAWFRMRLEREAYEETVRAYFEIGGREAAARLRDHVIQQFTSGSYGWMWPFRRGIERWFDGLVEKLEERYN